MPNKNLVIVESPTKAKTIGKFLGSTYKVESSYGHIRDLPKSKMGVNIEKNYEPQYEIPAKAKKKITEIKKLAKNAEKIILATDEDREGEAIAWHLKEILSLDKKKYERIVFHEITKEAINEALNNPREIDESLVDSQQARRILDRLVGYTLSPLLWSKIRRGLSAGRVQSAALRLIVEREEEIGKFKPQEYWSIIALLQKENSTETFEAKLFKANDKRLDKFAIKNKSEADEILKNLENSIWQVANIETKDTVRNPSPPFTTSTLQQEANRKLNFSGKKTMVVAQQLYEGIEIGDEDATGLITYMRTDSLNLAKSALEESKKTINDLFGKEYSLETPRFYKTKSKGAQEAHEAIRPTTLSRHPESIKDHLNKDQYRLYDLIWKRTLASQMAQAKLKNTAVDIKTQTPYDFRATGQQIIFDGFIKIYEEGQDEESQEKSGFLPALEEKEILKKKEIQPNQHFTQPPPRFTDASLVKALEEYGIGRPSTYAPTISTLADRDYIEREQKKLIPTEIGTIVTNFLKEHFPNIVDYKFTAEMEEGLDEVAEGNIKWQPLIKDFYEPFSKEISVKQKNVEKIVQKLDIKCPECQSPMVAKFGRFGKFAACSRYPECKTTVPLDEQENKLTKEAEKHKCPECQAPMVLKQGRFGSFLGCSKYPDCKGILKIQKEFGSCPDCEKGTVVERKAGKSGRIFYGCSLYPDCKFTTAKKPGEAEIKVV